MTPLAAARTPSQRDPFALFSRHLDLAALGRRRRGLVRCIFHGERTASLSVDLDAGLFHCFGCGAEGGIKRFAELVGEMVTLPSSPPAPDSEIEQARRRVLGQERSRQARMAEWWPLLHSMAWLRMMERLIAAIRAVAPDTPAGWAALEDAAVVERFVDAKTAEIEGLLAAGRMA